MIKDNALSLSCLPRRFGTQFFYVLNDFGTKFSETKANVKKMLSPNDQKSGPNSVSRLAKHYYFKQTHNT